MQRTRQVTRWVPVSFLGLAALAVFALPIARGGEKPPSADQEAAKKAAAQQAEEARQEKLLQEQMEAEQKALEKQLREDPAWQPSHVQVGVIRVSPQAKQDFVHCFCLDPDGNLLVGCGGKRQFVTEDKDGKPVEHTEIDPCELRTYSPEGALQKTWKVETEPQAIAMLPDGTIFVAGDGRLLKLDSDGKIQAKAAFPSLAKATPAKKKKKSQTPPAGKALGEEKADEQKAEGDAEMAAALAEFRRAATGLAVTDTEVFLVSLSSQGMNYAVWRMDHDFKEPKEIITGLTGCCGQMDIQAAGGDLWIPENGRHRVTRYDREGKKLASFGKHDRKAADGFGGCCEPKNLAIGPDGEIFTAESGEPVVVKRFSPEGKFQNVVAIPQYKTGCVHVCVAAGQDGRIFILNPGASAIHVFADQRKTPTHAFARKIGIADASGSAAQVNSFCLDAGGNILAACAGPNGQGQVHVVSAAGKLQATWKLDFVPQAINRAADGMIYAGGTGAMARFNGEGKLLQEAKLPSDIEPLAPGEEKKLREELQKIQADHAKLFEEYAVAQQRVVKAQQELADAEQESDAAITDSEKSDAARQVEKWKAEQAKARKDFVAMIPAVSPFHRAMREIQVKLGRTGNRGTVTGIAATTRDVFVCRMPDAGYGYEVWRTDRNFGAAKKIITGLAGCCGQMDVQADGDELWIPENGRHQVHRYDRDGKLLFTFGKNDRSALDGFGGCCEPKNIRLVGDEIFTAESTQPVQVKHFAKDGRFLGIVAVPTYQTGCVRVCVELSTDKRQIFILSPGENAIYVYEKGDPKMQQAAASISQQKDEKCKDEVR